MAGRKNFYLDQEVASSELNAAFAYLEQADRALMTDQGITGVLANGVVVQHTGTPNLSVDISGNAVAYDNAGERVSWGAPVSVDVSQDSNHVTTAVASSGHEKWVAVFAIFKRVLTDPRIDGNGATVYFDQAESFDFVVTQGAAAPIGTAPKPALINGGILLADINFTFGLTAVLNSMINTARRMDAIVIA